MATRTDRIAAAFARTAESGRAAALIPYIAAGDPSPETTVPLMHALVEAGADVIELGVPFSDPMADGPVIQRAAERAIAQGVGLARVLEMVAEFRQRDTATPVVLMGYANPIERMGQERFAREAAQAGVDGVLVVDYPPEEVVEFAAALGGQGIAPIFLLAPTSTEERIKAVAEVARGYVYYVSLKGVTGSGSLNTDDVAERVALIRRHVRDIPVGVGFGIRDAESAQRVARAADAVVIGSKLIETMEQAVADVPAARKTDAAVAAASGWLRTIRQALDLVKRENASA
ncbi:tryptophan synthase subunit alpha [Achromobacter veterisilvae]|jgi:tryptophan synthase alpha chain|uniref:Tryptophan synthase alpha chain n=1 Tax=Achromobacter veterisilvae TaxID=2069367 RepID=A0A446CM62_9BURK|nr:MULTISPECIES: tryptophan synthase subunit alpha [Achromobacter]MCW0208893.1 tryptophan synthase subunit alpha [Achromobacter sp.]SSW68881.1 Tryptophan synthase alpha chain [Achromobacter veterisilvae]